MSIPEPNLQRLRDQLIDSNSWSSEGISFGKIAFIFAALMGSWLALKLWPQSNEFDIIAKIICFILPIAAFFIIWSLLLMVQIAFQAIVILWQEVGFYCIVTFGVIFILSYWM